MDVRVDALARVNLREGYAARSGDSLEVFVRSDGRFIDSCSIEKRPVVGNGPIRMANEITDGEVESASSSWNTQSLKSPDSIH